VVTLLEKLVVGNLKKTIKHFIIGFILSFISSCKWSHADLGDNYFYLDKNKVIDVGFSEGAIIYNSHERYYFKNILIRGDVLEVNSDDKFIIAKRDPLTSRKNNTGILEYFIIQKKNDSLIGPIINVKFYETISNLRINLEFE
jgi:hypothetical protein